MRKRAAYKWLIVAAVLLACIVAILPLAQTIKWVGDTDLQVHFIVTDAATGQPVKNATVNVRAESGGFCNETDAREFKISTDNYGYASRLCTSCMCCGSRGVLEDTFAVYLPFWWYHATAEGYTGSNPEFLDVLKNRQRVQRGEPFATITVPIRLHKTTATQPTTIDPPAK